MSVKKILFDFFVKNGKSSAEYMSWDNIRTVLLLFESDFQEKNEDIKEIIKHLKDEGKKVFGCGYVDKKNAESVELETYMILDNSSYTFWNRPKENILNKLCLEKYDVVIDLSQEECLPLKYVLLSVEASMRCGKQVDANMYDFMIDLPKQSIPEDETTIDLSYSDTKELYAQIERYLKMMKNKA